MAAKYYASFLLQDTHCERCSEFSGVVEVERARQTPFTLREVEELLARNFQVETEDVKVIHWSRLH